MASSTARRALVGTVILAGLVFYAFFFLLVTPDRMTGREGPLHYEFEEDDDEAVGQPHVVTVRAWSERPGPLTVTLHHRAGTDGEFQALRMQRLGGGSLHAVELAPLPEGHRMFYYMQVRDAQGNQVMIPEQAPAAPLLHVRWEGHVLAPVLALHISLMIGALFFLVHGLHYAVRILGNGTGSQRATVHKAHRAILWGWLAFFVGGIPLGIYVSGTALSWPNAWGGWPLGTDITDTKTEILVVYWGLVVASKADHLHPRLKPWTMDRKFAFLVLGGAILTAIVYAIPHSYFVQ